MTHYLNGWTVTYGLYFDVVVSKGAEQREFKTLREAEAFARAH